MLMKGTGILLLSLAALAHALLVKEKGLYDWSLNNLGTVQYLHHYYEAGALKGLFVVTREGSLGLINAKTGGLQWRRALPAPRAVDYAIFRGSYAIVVTDANSSAELWHMGSGELLGSYPLQQNSTKETYVDATFINKNGEKQLSFALLSNQWLRVYKEKKEVRAYRALDNQTFCVCFYEPLYDKLSLGVIYQNANELTVLSIDNKKDSFVITSSFQFGQYDATLKKTWGHLLGVRTNVRNTLTFYSIVDAEALIEPMKAHMHSFYEPTEMIVTDDSSNFYINVIKRRQLAPVIALAKSAGEYAFGVSESQKKFAFTISTASGVSLYLSHDERPATLVCNFADDIQREFYGLPEKIWVDSGSDDVIIMTADKSLHMIHKDTRIWTRQEGLTGVSKWAIGKAAVKVEKKKVEEVVSRNPVERFVNRIIGQVNTLVEGTQKLAGMVKKIAMDKKYVKTKQARVQDSNYLFALTKYSKLYAFNAADGKIVWQRVLPGHVSDFFYFAGGEEDTIVVVVHSADSKKTFVREIFPTNGTFRPEQMEFAVNIVNTVAFTQKALGGKLLLLLDAEGKAYNYPDSLTAKLRFSRALQLLTLCDIDRTAGVIKGMKVNPRSLTEKEAWRLSLQHTGEEIVALASDDQLDPEQYQGIEEINGNIAYKFVDPNLMALATFAAPNHLYLYLINRANGTILYSGHVYNVYGKDSVKLSFVENTITLTYLKKYSERRTTLLNEVLVIELYFPHIENDVPQMISRHYSKGLQVGEPSSNKLPAPRIVTQTFIMPFPIKDLVFTRTRQGITNRHALILTMQNQILAIPGAMLDAKRPTGNANRGEALAFENADLPPYDAVIPISYTTALTYDLTMSGLQELRTLPHDYESTTLVVANGVDLFVSYFAPEKKYDRLSTEFNHWYMLLAVVGLVVTALVMARISSKKEANESYLTR